MTATTFMSPVNPGSDPGLWSGDAVDGVTGTETFPGTGLGGGVDLRPGSPKYRANPAAMVTARSAPETDHTRDRLLFFFRLFFFCFFRPLVPEAEARILLRFPGLGRVEVQTLEHV